MRGDGIRLSVGTFTRLPVPAPREVTPSTARAAVLLGPLVGLGLALAAAGVLLAGRWLVGGGVDALLPSALAVAALAWASGGLHLDGLADTADALGSRRPADGALAVMRRSDVGPLGAVTLVLVLLVQVVALAAATGTGRGTESLVLAVVTGRLAVVLGCTRGVPPARSDGLGATVAGVVPWPATVATVGIVLAGAALLGVSDADGGVVQSVGAVLAGLAAAVVGLGVAVRRFGGVTGDVLGAQVEVATAVVLVALAASPDLGGPGWAWLPGFS